MGKAALLALAENPASKVQPEHPAAMPRRTVACGCAMLKLPVSNRGASLSLVAMH